MASKNSTNGSEKQSSLEEQRAKVNEVRASLGPLSDKLALYCSDAAIARYLTARSWNVKKSIKMLKATLKWRLEYKPEEIRWEEIANEADTGKIYRASFVDKYGRSVLVMRPGCQNTKSTKGQIRYLVYCMENAILNLPADQEQMVWLIDFQGFNMSHISVKVTKETANVLQGHYPERLGVAILYNPPKFFESFWMVVKPFLEPKTYRKVKFVYSDNPGTRKNMEDLFNLDELERAFGGNNATSFNISEYAERMREDDKRMPLFWSQENTVASSEPLAKTIANLNSGISESDSDDSNEHLEGDLSSNKPASTMSALDSFVVADDKGNDAADEHAELEGVSSSSNSESKSLRELEGVLSSSKLASTMSALDSLVVADDKGHDAADVHAELERVSSSSKSESKSLRELEGVSSSNKLTSIMSALDSLVITDDKGNDTADEHAELEGVSSNKSESKSSADNRSPGSNDNLSGPGDVQSVPSEKDHSVRP